VKVIVFRKFIASIGSRPSDHYFRSVCLSVCLFVQSFSQPSLCPLEYRGCVTAGGWVTPKKLVFLGVLVLKKLSPPTVLIGLSWFLVILYNAPILKFSRAIFCNFHLEPKLWRHQWRHFWLCKSCRRSMRFSPLDSSEDFMGRGGLRFSLL